MSKKRSGQLTLHTTIDSSQTAGKLSKKLHGPFKVTKVALGGSFTAEEVNGKRIVRLPAANARRLKNENKRHSNP